MKKIITLIAISLFLSACTTTPLPTTGPLLVSAIAKSSEYTGWYRDFCTYNQPKNDKNEPYGTSCESLQILHHAYINKVSLAGVFDLNGNYYGGNIYAGVSGGERIYWNGSNEDYEHFILQQVSSEFEGATGIRYLMTPVVYNRKSDCVSNFGVYPHTDTRACPDREFHDVEYNDCISTKKVLKHFANG